MPITSVSTIDYGIWPGPSAVTARIDAKDRALALVYLQAKLEKEKAPMRRQALQREIREIQMMEVCGG